MRRDAFLFSYGWLSLPNEWILLPWSLVSMATLRILWIWGASVIWLPWGPKYKTFLIMYGTVIDSENLIDLEHDTSGCIPIYILNQIPNATTNIFLNNSKSTECRLIPFNPWLDKCVLHSVFGFERSAWLHAWAFAFCLRVPPFQKGTKKTAELTVFSILFYFVNVLFLSFVGILQP